MTHYLDTSNSDFIRGESSTNISSRSSEASFISLQQSEQIRRLEEALMNLDTEENLALSIVDFSPDWCEADLGCKVLICIEPELVVP